MSTTNILNSSVSVGQRYHFLWYNFSDLQFPGNLVLSRQVNSCWRPVTVRDKYTAVGAGGLEFDSRAGQSWYCANNSPPLRCFFFFRSWVVQALNRRSTRRTLQRNIASIMKIWYFLFQAVDEVLSSLRPLFDRYPKYLNVLLAIIEPERVVQFRVPWQDDQVGKCSRVVRPSWLCVYLV